MTGTIKTIPLTETELANRERLRLSKPRVHAKVVRFEQNLKAGRSAAIIQLQYSYRCNFHCSHCSISIFRRHEHDPNARLLDIPTVKRVFDEADEYGLAQVGVSGGEPTTFPDLLPLLEAIGMDRFHCQVDTNGWRMTPAMAAMLKSAGVDKVQISLDGMDADAHDKFRRKPGSYNCAIAAVKTVKRAGLAVQVATVVDHARAQSQEFVDFLKLVRDLGAPASVVYAKPSGEWQGRQDILCTPQDIAHVKSLLRQYGGYDHTSPGYGIDYGCLAVKRMFTITAYGDILPCPWMMWSLGNIFDTPLADILAKGMKRFGPYFPVCRLSESKPFLDLYQRSLRGKPLPVPIEQTGYETRS